QPELADDLGGRQVAIEALLAGRAEGAVEHAARLARDAQRPAPRLGNEHRFDGILAVDLEQPLARSVLGQGVADDARRSDARRGGELVAQSLGEIAHAAELALAALVHPAQHLAGTERLLPELGEEAGEAGRVEIEEILHRLKTWLGLKKYSISVRAFSTLSEPCTALASIESAKSARMVPFAAFFGSVVPISSRFFATALSPSSTWTSTGPEVMNLTRSPKNGRSLWTA